MVRTFLLLPWHVVQVVISNPKIKHVVSFSFDSQFGVDAEYVLVLNVVQPIYTIYFLTQAPLPSSSLSHFMCAGFWGHLALREALVRIEGACMRGCVLMFALMQPTRLSIPGPD